MIIPYERILAQMKTLVGLIFDDSYHYLDHLAPFCALNGWPLIVCDAGIANLAQRYYPELKIIETNIEQLKLPAAVVSCDPKPFIESIVEVHSLLELYWLPHGNSDKGWKTPIFEPLQKENAFVYGQKMIDFMRQQNVFPHTIRIGNFRLDYWMRHRTFYDEIMKQEISLPKAKITYLYAPTWNDAENNGTIWETLPLISLHLPDDCNLIIKIHPNTYRQYAPEIEQWMGRCAHQPNICFLIECPLIYPLLNLCDVYIGDASSIGYDFLYWNRPMFFLKSHRHSQFLYQCGVELLPEESSKIFDKYYDDLGFQKIRKQIYEYTFDSSPQYRARFSSP